MDPNGSTARAVATKRRVACPDEHDLAALIDGRLAGAARDALVAHTASCPQCRTVIGTVIRTAAGSEAAVPSGVFERGVDAGTRRRLIGRAAWAAMAASLLIGTALWQMPARVGDARIAPATPPVDESRRDAGAQQPRLLQPAAGQPIGTTRVRFSWIPVVDAVGYELQLTTMSGDLVWREAVTSLETELPPNVVLQPATEYYAWVSAVSADGRRLPSDIVMLRTNPQP